MQYKLKTNVNFDQMVQLFYHLHILVNLLVFVQSIQKKSALRKKYHWSYSGVIKHDEHVLIIHNKNKHRNSMFYALLKQQNQFYTFWLIFFSNENFMSFKGWRLDSRTNCRYVLKNCIFEYFFFIFRIHILNV